MAAKEIPTGLDLILDKGMVRRIRKPNTPLTEREMAMRGAICGCCGSAITNTKGYLAYMDDYYDGTTEGAIAVWNRTYSKDYFDNYRTRNGGSSHIYEAPAYQQTILDNIAKGPHPVNSPGVIFTWGTKEEAIKKFFNEKPYSDKADGIELEDGACLIWSDREEESK